MKDCEVCICPDCRKQEECEICNNCFNCPAEGCKSECDDMILTAQASLLNDIPEKVIKTDTCSQACPACHSPVNGNYCHNCGKALSY